MSDDDWYGVPDELVPVTCPNCFEETGEDIPLIRASISVPERLTMKMVIFGTCPRCGESVACVYWLEEDADDEDIFPALTN